MRREEEIRYEMNRCAKHDEGLVVVAVGVYIIGTALHRKADINRMLLLLTMTVMIDASNSSVGSPLPAKMKPKGFRNVTMPCAWV